MRVLFKRLANRAYIMLEKVNGFSIAFLIESGGIDDLNRQKILTDIKFNDEVETTCLLKSKPRWTYYVSLHSWEWFLLHKKVDAKKTFTVGICW